MGSTIIHIARGIFICTVFYLLGQFVSRFRSPSVPSVPCVDILTANLSLPYHCYFLDSYFASRNAFVSLSKHIALPITKDLTTDVAVIPGRTDEVILHLSGTHGVEGYAGSGIQLAMLHNMSLGVSCADSSSSSQDCSAKPTYIFVHAVNPFGYANNRRMNENNIDLNRNALTPQQFDEVTKRNPNYAHHVDLAEAINPSKPLAGSTLLNDIFAIINFSALVYGFRTVKQALVSGNYHNPTGISYGGTSLSTSLSRLFELLPKLLSAEVSRVAVIDVHTGLGPTGVDTLMSNVPDDVLEQYFPLEILHNDSKKHKPKVLGGLKTGTGVGQEVSRGYELTVSDEIFQHIAPQNKMCVVQELGTLSPILVGKAIVEENQATHQGPASLLPFYRQRSKDAFYVDKRSWKHSVVHRGGTVLLQAKSFVERSS